MEAITGSQSRLARATSEMWPACRAPMVGTKPMMRLSARACRAASFIQAMVRMVSNGRAGASGRGCGTFAIEVHEVGEDWLRAELPKHGGDLASMVGAVIYDVLHGLPKRI